MLFAVLAFTDFVILTVIFAVIGVIVASLASREAATVSDNRPGNRDRLQTIEHKLNRIMKQIGLDDTPPSNANEQQAANHPAEKNTATNGSRGATRRQVGGGHAAGRGFYRRGLPRRVPVCGRVRLTRRSR